MSENIHDNLKDKDFNIKEYLSSSKCSDTTSSSISDAMANLEDATRKSDIKTNLIFDVVSIEFSKLIVN